MSDEKNQACLHDLRATDPRLDKARIEQAKGGLLRDSYRWVLGSTEFRQWQESKESPLLWIKGGPGKGKTMLLCGIIDELALSATQGVNLVFFFCQATNAHIDNAAAVLRGLIWMLVKQQPALVSHLRTYYDDMGSRQWEGANAWVALSRIFREILRDDRLQTSYLIVDALDECTTDLPLLLDLIQSSLAHSQVKWIVSSRDWPSIAKGLVQAAAKVSLCLELNEDAVSEAVSKYIQFQVEELAKKNRYKNDTRDAVERYLSENANGTFLWVALVCQELSNIAHWRVPKKLTTDMFPPGLDDLYRRMLHHIPAEDAELCTRILATMSAVYRPITLEELTALVELPEGLSQDDLEVVIGLCGSFLTLREHVISFVHQSAKDFLLDKGPHEDFPLEVESVHETIFSRSLQVMSRTLRRDIYDLKAPGYPVDHVQPPHPDPLAAVRYSCVHWVDHLCESTLMSRYLQDSGPVDAFLRRHFLHWLEALCLLASLSHGILSMVKLKDTLQDQASQLAKLARDGDRFVRFCKQAIEGNPLQLYASALIFSPSKCMIRELFKQEEPHWITTQPLVEDSWNACTQTLEGHGNLVMCLASAPDGRTVASGSYNGTIKIWDISTGTCMQTLEGHDDGVLCLAFTPDGRTIASGSYDRTVKIWEVATGVCRQTLSGHNKTVTLIAFTPGGTLISGSRDSTVMVWDVTTSTCLQALVLDDGHSDLFAFAPDRRTIAYGSLTGIISIWDMGTGTRMQTLQGQDGPVWCLAFAPDGRALATAFNNIIKIWDTVKGTCIQTLDIHGNYTHAIAFTPDGCMLISGCDDCTVRIWDIATGASLRVLESHSSGVWSIAVIPKGQMLASGSLDCTVKIWDMAIDAVTQTQKLGSHDDGVSSVAFAPDGRTIATVSFDHTVKIWDVATGACTQTLEGHGELVMKVAFAYDSHTLVTASHDDTFRIWDMATSVCTRTLEFDAHDSWVTSMTFTRDSRMFASGYENGVIDIRDVATGACTRTLEPERDDSQVMAMAFTHDGRKLASARGYSAVEIWDVTTGTRAQMLKLRRLVRNLEFGYDNTRLHTDIGTIDLDLVRNIPASELRDHPVLQPCSPRYSICEENTWITWKDERILWLPPEYRPGECAIVNTTIAIGCVSGRVLILSFSADEPVI
ncbi:WD40 repeat-like protein [Coniochaeta sp. PMI_546]|nr:WD40 repeat-like protein [Coniochaeta sp. PMI_546]